MLSQLKILGYCALGLIVVSLFLALQMEKRHSRKLADRNTWLVAELKRISTAKDEQRARTVVNIVKAGEGGKAAERVAKRVDAAPIVPNKCATAREILEADL